MVLNVLKFIAILIRMTDFYFGLPKIRKIIVIKKHINVFSKKKTRIAKSYTFFTIRVPFYYFVLR